MSYATTATDTFAGLGFVTVVARHVGKKVPTWAELETALTDILGSAADLIIGHGFFRVADLAVAPDARDCNAIYVVFGRHDDMRAFLYRPVPPSTLGITMEYRLGSPTDGYLMPSAMPERHTIVFGADASE